MTAPVFTSRTQSDGEEMEMTTPVITKKVITCIKGCFFPSFLGVLFLL